MVLNKEAQKQLYFTYSGRKNRASNFVEQKHSQLGIEDPRMVCFFYAQEKKMRLLFKRCLETQQVEILLRAAVFE